MNTPLRYFSSFINTGHERSIRAKKNIVFSFILKAVSVFIQFLFVPLLIDYLSPLKYGIWITVGSIINWFYLLDVGLGNGLRNKLAEAFANDEKQVARIYISTTYTALAIIVFILYSLFLIADRFIYWPAVFNSPEHLTPEVNGVVIIVFTFFALNFIARLIGSVLNADQKSSMNDLFYTTGNLLALIAVIIMKNIGYGSLVSLGLIMGITSLLPVSAASLFLFNNQYKAFKPSFRFIKFKYIHELISLGIKFFVMQVAVIVVFATDNLIITQLFGPEQVTPYNVALKYFNIIIMGFAIVLTPLWSAYTEAYTKNDFAWIQSKIKKLIQFWCVLVFIVAGMVFISGWFYRFWVGDNIYIPFSLSLLMALFVIMTTWNNIFAFFLNGVGKIKLQMYYGILAMLINIPISIFYAKTLGLGISGVILGTCTSIMFGFILGPIQYLRIIRKTASGIWAL